jgi:hypothetical protein
MRGLPFRWRRRGVLGHSGMMKLALLDDYHRVATRMADWVRLAGRVEVASFDAKIADADELVRRLAPFDAILAMRERTAFPRSVLEGLPNLRLLITTGMWNAAIDVDAATKLGVQVCGTRDVGHLTAELTLAGRKITFDTSALGTSKTLAQFGAVEFHSYVLGFKFACIFFGRRESHVFIVRMARPNANSQSQRKQHANCHITKSMHGSPHKN